MTSNRYDLAPDEQEVTRCAEEAAGELEDVVFLLTRSLKGLRGLGHDAAEREMAAILEALAPLERRLDALAETVIDNVNSDVQDREPSQWTPRMVGR